MTLRNLTIAGLVIAILGLASTQALAAIDTTSKPVVVPSMLDAPRSDRGDGELRIRQGGSEEPVQLIKRKTFALPGPIADLVKDGGLTFRFGPMNRLGVKFSRGSTPLSVHVDFMLSI